MNKPVNRYFIYTCFVTVEHYAQSFGPTFTYTPCRDRRLAIQYYSVEPLLPLKKRKITLHI